MRTSRPIALAYGVGELAKGVEDGATNLFMLFFFSQVLGLPGWLVGASMGISLVIDAVADPLVGSWSDGTRSRWGRRHPFLLASVLPSGLTFAMLFMPPAMGMVGVFLWFTFWLLALRLALTVFLVPHMALGAELSDDYDERTRIAAIRVFFTYLGAAVLVGVSRAVFFKPTAVFADGQLNPAAYPKLGVAFGLFIVVTTLASTLGTWSRIPYLPGGSPKFEPEPDLDPELAAALRRAAARPGFADPSRTYGDSEIPAVPRARVAASRGIGGAIRGLVAEQKEAFSNPAFAVLVASLLLFFIARGTALSLDLYVGTYFWGLGTDAVALPGFALLGILIGSPLSVLVARKVDKRHLFVWGMGVYALLTMTPPLLHVLGLFPSGALLRPTLGLTIFLSGMVGGAAFVASASILADVVDAHELSTGFRREGLFFGALSFARKAATGVGTILGGLFLSVVSFPTQALPGTVDPGLVKALGLVSGPGTAIFGVLGVVLASRYRADRGAHEATRAALRARENA